MTIARRTPVTRTDLRTAIRAEVRDPATLRNGTSKAAASLRWSNTEIDAALNMALEELQHELGIANPGERLLSVDATYAQADGEEDMALPSPMTSADLVYKVEELGDPNRPRPIEYVSPLEIEQFSRGEFSSTLTWSTYRYTLVARDVALRIAIRPVASPNIRISYIAPATILGADGDTHPSTSRWYEFLVLSTAQKLLRPDDEFSAQQTIDLERHRDYIQGTSSRAGPQRIRSRRRYR